MIKLLPERNGRSGIATARISGAGTRYASSKAQVGCSGFRRGMFRQYIPNLPGIAQATAETYCMRTGLDWPTGPVQLSSIARTINVID